MHRIIELCFHPQMCFAHCLHKIESEEKAIIFIYPDERYEIDMVGGIANNIQSLPHHQDDSK